MNEQNTKQERDVKNKQASTYELITVEDNILLQIQKYFPDNRDVTTLPTRTYLQSVYLLNRMVDKKDRLLMGKNPFKNILNILTFAHSRNDFFRKNYAKDVTQLQIAFEKNSIPGQVLNSFTDYVLQKNDIVSKYSSSKEYIAAFETKGADRSELFVELDKKQDVLLDAIDRFNMYVTKINNEEKKNG